MERHRTRTHDRRRMCVYIVLMHGDEESFKDHSWRIESGRMGEWRPLVVRGRAAGPKLMTGRGRVSILS